MNINQEHMNINTVVSRVKLHLHPENGVTNVLPVSRFAGGIIAQKKYHLFLRTVGTISYYQKIMVRYKKKYTIKSLFFFLVIQY